MAKREGAKGCVGLQDLQLVEPPKFCKLWESASLAAVAAALRQHQRGLGGAPAAGDRARRRGDDGAREPPHTAPLTATAAASQAARPPVQGAAPRREPAQQHQQRSCEQQAQSCTQRARGHSMGRQQQGQQGHGQQVQHAGAWLQQLLQLPSSTLSQSTLSSSSCSIHAACAQHCQLLSSDAATTGTAGGAVQHARDQPPHVQSQQSSPQTRQPQQQCEHDRRRCVREALGSELGAAGLSQRDAAAVDFFVVQSAAAAVAAAPGVPRLW